MILYCESNNINNTLICLLRSYWGLVIRGNCLVLSGNKPLPHPILIQEIDDQYGVTGSQWIIQRTPFCWSLSEAMFQKAVGVNLSRNMETVISYGNSFIYRCNLAWNSTALHMVTPANFQSDQKTLDPDLGASTFWRDVTVRILSFMKERPSGHYFHLVIRHFWSHLTNQNGIT